MYTNILKGLNIAVLMIIITSFAHASPQNRNTKGIQEVNHQAKQLEALYQAYLKRKAVNNKNSTKPRLIKASFNPSVFDENPGYSNRLRVTATAYTSHVGQTDSTPNVAAWGDRLRPGMKAIAVSRDLLKVYGLKRGQKVRIKGLKGEYIVLDKMNKRWRKKIDIYMGMNKRKAFKWGRRKVDIMWN